MSGVTNLPFHAIKKNQYYMKVDYEKGVSGGGCGIYLGANRVCRPPMTPTMYPYGVYSSSSKWQQSGVDSRSLTPREEGWRVKKSVKSAEFGWSRTLILSTFVTLHRWMEGLEFKNRPRSVVVC